MRHMITKIISVHRILMTQMYEPGTVGGRDGGPWRRDSGEGDEGEEMVVGGWGLVLECLAPPLTPTWPSLFSVSVTSSRPESLLPVPRRILRLTP